MSGISDLGGYLDMIPGVRQALGAVAFLNIIGVIGAIVILVAFYVITAFKWQFIGRKAGLQKDWMPFVPFARTVYKLSIVDEQWWKMFFLDGWWLYGYLLYTIVNAISNNAWVTFSVILVTVYLLCCLAYNIYWRYKFYMAHNIKPHLSMSILVPGLGTIRTVWDYIIAFGRNYPFTGEGTSRAVMDVMNVPQMKDEHGNPVALTRAISPSDRGAPWAGGGAQQPQQAAARAAAPAPAAGGAGGGSVTGMSGMYAGQTLPLAPGDEMVIGRDNAFSNLIVDQNADKVSRKHCGILFNLATGSYQVTDYSTNGTFVDGGNRLVANMPTTLARGTVIALGNRENRFKLN